MTTTIQPVTYIAYLETPPDADVAVQVNVSAGRLHVGGVEYGPGDNFIYTGPKRVVRSWERAGQVSVATVKKRKPRSRKAKPSGDLRQ